MGNEMFQARLDDDFADRIHEYREDNYMNKSEAVRHLLRVGLEAETREEEDSGEGRLGVLERLAGPNMMGVAVVLLFLSALSMGGAAWVGTSSIIFMIGLLYLSFFLMLASLAILGVGLAAMLALERPLQSLIRYNQGTADE